MQSESVEALEATRALDPGSSEDREDGETPPYPALRFQTWIALWAVHQVSSLTGAGHEGSLLGVILTFREAFTESCLAIFPTRAFRMTQNMAVVCNGALGIVFVARGDELFASAVEVFSGCRLRGWRTPSQRGSNDQHATWMHSHHIAWRLGTA
jgi:hypothetical protein